MQFTKIYIRNMTLKESKELIGNISKNIFKYDIIKYPARKDMDSKCSYITINFESDYRGGVKAILTYSPLKISIQQERNFSILTNEIKKNINR